MTLSRAEIEGMGRSVARTVFLHRATVQRSTPGAPDRGGQPTSTWGDHLVRMPCFYWREDEEMLTGPAINAVIGRPRIKFPARTPIRAGDRVTVVVDRDGAVLAADLQVREVLPNKASVICELWEAD